MKRLLVILLFLMIGVSGCDSTEEKIYVGRVDVLSDINKDDCTLVLNFFSTNTYDEIKCILEDEVLEYTYTVDKNNLITSKNSDNCLYSHQVILQFEKQEVELEEVIMEFDGVLKVFDIGRFIITDVFKKYNNTNNIIIDVMGSIDEQKSYVNDTTMSLKVTNLSKYNISMIGLSNLNSKAGYKIIVSKINDVAVASNEVTISEEIEYQANNNSYLLVSTYLKYDYSYQTNQILTNWQYFKIELDVSETLDFYPELSSLELGTSLQY